MKGLRDAFFSTFYPFEISFLSLLVIFFLPFSMLMKDPHISMHFLFFVGRMVDVESIPFCLLLSGHWRHHAHDFVCFLALFSFFLKIISLLIALLDYWSPPQRTRQYKNQKKKKKSFQKINVCVYVQYLFIERWISKNTNMLAKDFASHDFNNTISCPQFDSICSSLISLT